MDKRFNQWVKRVGGASKAALLLNPHAPVKIYRQKVELWVKHGVPPEGAIAVEHVVGIPRAKLCPTVFYEVA